MTRAHLGLGRKEGHQVLVQEVSGPWAVGHGLHGPTHGPVTSRGFMRVAEVSFLCAHCLHVAGVHRPPFVFVRDVVQLGVSPLARLVVEVIVYGKAHGIVSGRGAFPALQRAPVASPTLAGGGG